MHLDCVFSTLGSGLCIMLEVWGGGRGGGSVQSGPVHAAAPATGIIFKASGRAGAERAAGGAAPPPPVPPRSHAPPPLNQHTLNFTPPRTSWATPRPRAAWWTSTCATPSAGATARGGALFVFVFLCFVCVFVGARRGGRGRGGGPGGRRPGRRAKAGRGGPRADAAPPRRRPRPSHPSPPPPASAGVEFSAFMRGEGYDIIPITGAHQLAYGGSGAWGPA